MTRTRRAIAALLGCMALGAGQLAAETPPVQEYLVPRNIYVGDTARLSCTFVSERDFFAGAAVGADGALSLDPSVLQTERPLVLVTAPGPGSGKMAVCLSQLYQEHQRGIKAGYAKFETFPIWRKCRVRTKPPLPNATRSRASSRQAAERRTLARSCLTYSPTR